MKTISLFLSLLCILPSFVRGQNNVGVLQLDTSFASTGKHEFLFGGGDLDSVTAYVAFRGAAQTIAAGKIRSSGSETHFGIVSYDSNGKASSGFGTNGTADLRWTGVDYPEHIILLPDNSILAAGASKGANGSLVPSLFHIKANGTPDSSFGANGQLSLPYDTTASGHFTHIDTTFAGNHTLQSFVVTGTSTVQGATGVYACRFTSNFALDPSFGSGGKAWITTPIVKAEGAMMGDRSILFVAIAEPSRSLSLIRLTAAGALDQSFGTGGTLNTNQTVSVAPLACARQFDSALIVLSTLDHSSYPFALIRFKEDGSYDTAYGNKGFAYDSATIGMTAKGLSLTNDRSTLVSGHSSQHTSAVTKFFPTGKIDSSFGSFGVASIDPDSGHRPNEAIGFMPIGRPPFSKIPSLRLVAVGNPFYVARFVSAPRLEAPLNVDFGFIEIGSQITKSAILYNKKPVSVTISAFVIAGSQAYTVDSPAVPLTIPAYDSATLRIRFQPTNDRSANGLLTFRDDEPNIPPEVFLSGIGVPKNAVRAENAFGSTAIAVAPNPAVGTTNARIFLNSGSNHSDLRAELYDPASRLVRIESLGPAADASEFPFTVPATSGIYLLRILSGGSVIGTQRVIVLP